MVRHIGCYLLSEVKVEPRRSPSFTRKGMKVKPSLTEMRRVFPDQSVLIQQLNDVTWLGKAKGDFNSLVQRMILLVGTGAVWRTLHLCAAALS